MLIEVVNLETYKSKSGNRFKVINIARHAQDCSRTMIVFTNIDKTIDSPAGTVWVLSESLFLKRFNEI